MSLKNAVVNTTINVVEGHERSPNYMFPFTKPPIVAFDLDFEIKILESSSFLL